MSNIAQQLKQILDRLAKVEKALDEDDDNQERLEEMLEQSLANEEQLIQLLTLPSTSAVSFTAEITLP